MKFLQIKDQELAQQASEFLTTGNAFEDSVDWNETEKEHLVKSPFRVFSSENYFAWVMKDKNDEIIGYIDLREHDLKNDGYYTDWFVVHREFRSKGIGAEMLKEVESFAKSIGARYILIETGDISAYDRTRAFYENHNYVKVGRIPEYYYKNWGMYIYQKLFQQD